MPKKRYAISILITLLMVILCLSEPAKSSATNSNVELVGQFGGQCRAAIVQGGYAYIGEGDGLRILDVSNSAAPKPLGKAALPGFIVYGVAISGNYAYVAHGDEGAWIVDISNPAAPVPLGSLGTQGTAFGITVSDNLAYVADYPFGLHIIDVSNPTAPVLRGAFDTPGIAYNVTISGTLAYVADGDSGLQIIDVSNPAAPVLRGSYNTPSCAQGVAISGNLAYVADIQAGLLVVDVSNPAAPLLRGSYDTDAQASNIAVSGNMAYLANYDGGIKIIDVSNPVNPILRGSFDTSGYAVAVASSGGELAYLACTSDLKILNVSDPDNPTLCGSYNTPGNIQGLAVSGNKAYVADYYAGLEIIDVSVPATPVQRGSLGMTGKGIALDVAVSGSLACIAYYDTGLGIIDVSKPDEPASLAFCGIPGGPQSFAVSGNMAYVAASGSGLQIVDLSNPATPFLRGSFATPGYANQIAVSEGMAYLCAGGSDFKIIDVSNPAAPLLRGSATPAGGMVVRNGLAYVANGKLQIIDVTNPNMPIQRGSCVMPGSAQHIAISGTIACVLTYPSGIQVVDVSDSNAPVLCGSFDTSFFYDCVAVSGNLIYITNPDRGLLILKYTGNFAPPTLHKEPIFTKGTTNSLVWASQWEGKTTYTLQMSSTGNFSSPTTLDLPATKNSYMFSDLADGATYWYRVRVLSQPGNLLSDWSAVTSSTQDATPPDKPPKPFSAEPVTTSTQATFQWEAATDAVSGVDYYQVTIGTASGLADVLNTTSTILSSLATGSPGQILYCRVRAIDKVGNIGPWSDTSEPVRINRVPTVQSLAISPESPGTDDDLAANLQILDPDGDAIRTVKYEWYLNNVLQGTDTTLPADKTTRGQVWEVRVSAQDEFGAWGNISRCSITIQNTPPTQPLVQILPRTPSVSEDLIVDVLEYSSDADGDTVAYDFQWFKSINGGTTWIHKVELDGSSQVSHLYINEGEIWQVRYVPYEKASASITLSALGKKAMAERVEGAYAWDQVYIGSNHAPTLSLTSITGLRAEDHATLNIKWIWADQDKDACKLDLYLKGGGYTELQPLAKGLDPNLGETKTSTIISAEKPTYIHAVITDAKGAVTQVTSSAVVFESMKTQASNWVIYQ